MSAWRQHTTRHRIYSARFVQGAAIAATLAALTLGATLRFTRRLLTPAAAPDEQVRVLGVEACTSAPTGVKVWLTGPDAALEGSYSLTFNARARGTLRGVAANGADYFAGHARLGPVVQTVGRGMGMRVAREVLRVDRGYLRAGVRGKITGWWYADPTQLGYRVRTVAIPVPGGVSWGWVITPSDSKPGSWAVHVHGRGVWPHETLRGVEACAQAGRTSLVLAYRNDPGAPRGVRGRYGLGLAEQYDVDAALGWVRSQGARRVTLFGWSMGGTAVMLAAGKRKNADLVDGVVLDSPALDWPGVLRQQARLARLPKFVARIAVIMLRSGVVAGAVPGTRKTALAALTPKRLLDPLRVPVLIHASAGDSYVPWRGALRAVQCRPLLVRLHAGRGEHVKLWNVNPAAWNTETAAFLAGLNQVAEHPDIHLQKQRG